MTPRPLAEVAGYFLRLGVFGFGGPNAHIAMMHEELVRRRSWVDERRFLDIVGATNLIPGPNSSEIAMHLGYERAGRIGGLVAGLCFALPAFVIVVALSWLYVHVGRTAGRASVLGGLQPAALVAIAFALWKLRAGVRGGNWVMPALAAAGLALTLAAPALAPLAIVCGGLVGLATLRAARGDALSIAPVGLAAAVGAAQLSGLPGLAWVFVRTGVLLFGGGLVLVPLLEPAVVAAGWMTRRQFLDGIAIGQTTPGPIVMTAAFVGFLVAGLGGAAVATAAIYLPSFLAVLFVSAPLMSRFKDDPSVRAFVAAVAATALGSVAASAVLLAPTAFTSALRVAVGLLAAAALWRRVAVAWVVLGAAAVGLAAGIAGVH